MKTADTLGWGLLMGSAKACLVFAAAAAVMTLMLTASALIPQAAIRDNTYKSAKYLCEKNVFWEVSEGMPLSKIDRYADSILLGIAYQYDSSHPLKSVMLSSYYHTDYMNENENLLRAVEDGEEPNQQYLRYWHGSIAVVRPLLLVFSIIGMYALMGGLLSAAALMLFVVLLKMRAYAPAVGLVLGLLSTAAWFVPLSLEYIWTYLLSLVLALIAVGMAYAGRMDRCWMLFLIGGMVTSFMDFLTTETLTLLIPLLLLMWMGRHPDAADKSRYPSGVKLEWPGRAALSWTFLWAFGYIGMWGLKWLLAAAVLKENVMPYVTANVEERLGDSLGSYHMTVVGTVFRNIGCLIPQGLGSFGVALGFMAVMIYAYIAYVYRKKDFDRRLLLVYILTGLMPYVRYIILRNHSFLHYFFTYRAQLATVLAAVLILDELVRRNEGVYPARVRKRKDSS